MSREQTRGPEAATGADAPGDPDIRLSGLVKRFGRVVGLSGVMTLEFIGSDELVEVTPKSIRLRKKYLDHNERKRYDKSNN